MSAAGILFLLVVAVGVPLLAVVGAPRAALLHAVFALAAMPLMTSAMLHFVPVLTRSGAPHAMIARLPWLTAAIGLGVVALLASGREDARRLLAPLAGLLILAIGVLLPWTLRRARQTLGRPHPGVYWYAAALVALLAGLLAAATMALLPAAFAPAYRFHVHINLFGWIGLTVLGTMPVLLPTALAAGDPGVAPRMRRTLPSTVAAVGLLAAGSAGQEPWSASVGAIILIGLIALHGSAWIALFRNNPRRAGPAASLAAAAGFLVVLLFAGIAHGFGVAGIDGTRLLPAFAAGFLLPTVLGALAQLLPVWRYPGPDSQARRRDADTLARGAGWRGAFAVTSGLAWLAGWPGAAFPAAGSVLWMLVAVVRTRIAPAPGNDEARR